MVTGQTAGEKADASQEEAGEDTAESPWGGPDRLLEEESVRWHRWCGGNTPHVLSEEDWPLDTVVAIEPGGRTAGSSARNPEAVEEFQSSFIRPSVADPRSDDLQEESRLVKFTEDILPDSAENEFDVETCGTASENLGKVPILRYVRCNLVSPPRYYK